MAAQLGDRHPALGLRGLGTDWSPMGLPTGGAHRGPDGVYLVRLTARTTTRSSPRFPASACTRTSPPTAASWPLTSKPPMLTSNRSTSRTPMARGPARSPSARRPSAPAGGTLPGPRMVDGWRSSRRRGSILVCRRIASASPSSTQPREPSGRWSTMTLRPDKSTSPVGRLMDAGSCSGVNASARAAPRWRCSWSRSTGRVCGNSPSGNSPNGACSPVTRTGHPTEGHRVRHRTARTSSAIMRVE
jgi:hypothetical protein